jgi:hypothetical protein
MLANTGLCTVCVLTAHKSGPSNSWLNFSVCILYNLHMLHPGEPIMIRSGLV